MRALEKDRNRRYSTANAFAQDVQHYLADEPVEACPPSTAYRAKKLLRRYKGPVLAAAVVLLTLLGGMAGTAWGWSRPAGNGTPPTRSACWRSRSATPRSRPARPRRGSGRRRWRPRTGR